LWKSRWKLAPRGLIPYYRKFAPLALRGKAIASFDFATLPMSKINKGGWEYQLFVFLKSKETACFITVGERHSVLSLIQRARQNCAFQPIR
jgi:hypothetical protein